MAIEKVLDKPVSAPIAVSEPEVKDTFKVKITHGTYRSAAGDVPTGGIVELAEKDAKRAIELGVAEYLTERVR